MFFFRIRSCLYESILLDSEDQEMVVERSGQAYNSNIKSDSVVLD